MIISQRMRFRYLQISTPDWIGSPVDVWRRHQPYLQVLSKGLKPVLHLRGGGQLSTIYLWE